MSEIDNIRAPKKLPAPVEPSAKNLEGEPGVGGRPRRYSSTPFQIVTYVILFMAGFQLEIDLSEFGPYFSAFTISPFWLDPIVLSALVGATLLLPLSINIGLDIIPKRLRQLGRLRSARP